MFLRGWLVFIVVSGTARSNGEKKAKPNDYFAAIVHMEPLVRREQLLTENFLEIINSEEQRLNKMEKEIDEIERVLPKPGYTPTEMTKFIGNSVNALKLLQRFTDFWPNITTKYSGENSTLRKYLFCLLKTLFFIMMFILQSILFTRTYESFSFIIKPSFVRNTRKYFG